MLFNGNGMARFREIGASWLHAFDGDFGKFIFYEFKVQNNSTSIHQPGYNINIYPNPTSNIANLQLSIKKTMNLEIGVYDVLGKKVQQMVNTKFSNGIHNISFDTSNLENGTYFIKYQSNEMVNNVKFVVAH